MAFAPVVAIWVQGPFMAGARSTLNPVSFVELSAQARLIWLEETAVAVRPLGAAGTVAAVGVAVGGVTTGVAVLVGVRVGVDVGAPAVKVGVGVRVGVGVDVRVAVGVGVRVEVAVGVGVAASVVADAVLDEEEIPAELVAWTR